MTAVPGRIDIHHHALSAGLIELMAELGLPTPAGQWRLSETLDLMDANNIEASVISNVIPCDVLGDQVVAARLARRANDEAAEAVRARPARFGFFAILPLPDVDLALEEAARALDELGADGVALLPHGGNRYLGAPVFDPLFAELDRRRTAVLVHPASLPHGGTPDVPPVIADFLLDTTRAAINLITSGTLARYPQVPVILSHAGGFLPYAATRTEVAASLLGMAGHDEVRGGIRRFYYDLALSVPSAMPTLLAAADPGRILFGTDWSGVPAAVVSQATRDLDEFPALGDSALGDGALGGGIRQAINRDNALKLLPGLARRLRAAQTPAPVR